jgi:hypothetical protein
MTRKAVKRHVADVVEGIGGEPGKERHVSGIIALREPPEHGSGVPAEWSGAASAKPIGIPTHHPFIGSNRTAHLLRDRSESVILLGGVGIYIRFPRARLRRDRVDGGGSQGLNRRIVLPVRSGAGAAACDQYDK